MPSFETQISISAPPGKIWSILTDFARFPDWNPFIRSIGGTPVQGAILSVEVAPPGQSAMSFKPVVLIATPERELRWLGTFMGRAVFAGEHYFRLEPQGTNSTRLVHGERFSGLLAPLIMRRQMLAATEQGFAAMNAALKQRAE